MLNRLSRSIIEQLKKVMRKCLVNSIMKWEGKHFYNSKNTGARASKWMREALHQANLKFKKLNFHIKLLRRKR